MKKVIGFLLTVALLLGGAYFGGAYYLGMQTEKTLNHRTDMIANNAWLEVMSRHYERRWFDATETVVVRVRPQVLAKVSESLPDQLKTLLREPVTLTSHAAHGPLVGMTPARAKVETTFQFTPDAQKTLKQFFGDATPVTMTDTIDFTGGGTLNANISRFDYKELSGLHIIWDGLTAVTRYTAQYRQYDTDLTSPGLKLILADLGEAQYQGLSYRVHTAEAKPVNTGNSLLNIKHIALKWNQSTDYRLRLNDLINMVSDLQVGNFINPTLSVPPAQVALDDLSFATSMTLQQGFVNANGKLNFAKLDYGDDRYGPLEVDVIAEHLNAPALAAFKQKLAELSARSDNAETWQDEVLAAVRNEGAPLFTDNPVLTLRTFNLTTPSGKVAVNGKVAFEDLDKADLDDFSLLLPKVTADLQYTMPQKMLESLAQTQVQSLFAVAEDADQSNLQDIQNTVHLMVDNLIHNMSEDGYLKLDSGILSGTIALSKGQLLMNGKAVQLPDDSAVEDMLNEDDHFTAANTAASEPIAASEPEHAASAAQ